MPGPRGAWGRSPPGRRQGSGRRATRDGPVVLDDLDHRIGGLADQRAGAAAGVVAAGIGGVVEEVAELTLELQDLGEEDIHGRIAIRQAQSRLGGVSIRSRRRPRRRGRRSPCRRGRGGRSARRRRSPPRRRRTRRRWRARPWRSGRRPRCARRGSRPRRRASAGGSWPARPPWRRPAESPAAAAAPDDGARHDVRPVNAGHAGLGETLAEDILLAAERSA